MKKFNSGKVRDIYEVDENSLMIVVSDRISAFDNIMPQDVPEKGVILNQISAFWFDSLCLSTPFFILSAPLLISETPFAIIAIPAAIKAAPVPYGMDAPFCTRSAPFCTSPTPLLICKPPLTILLSPNTLHCCAKFNSSPDCALSCPCSALYIVLADCTVPFNCISFCIVALLDEDDDADEDDEDDDEDDGEDDGDEDDDAAI
jgi:hypothetical protein